MSSDYRSERDSRARRRLASVAELARVAEARGDADGAHAAWHRYRLISDAQRDPDELLAEGIALSSVALALARDA